MRKIIILLFMSLIFSCQETFEFDDALVFTGDIVNPKDWPVLFSAKIVHRGKYPVIESGFVWSLYPNDQDGIKIINPDPSADSYSLQTNHTPLPGKKYYVRAYVKTSNAITYGRELSFKSSGHDSYSKIGKWSPVTENEEGSWCESISSSFSINGITYLLFGDGNMYAFDHATNQFTLLLKENKFNYSDFRVVYNGVAYLFFKNSFYSFNPGDLSFKKLSKWPVEDKYGTKGFLIDDNIYVGLGGNKTSEHSKEFLRYNISSDAWIKLSDFPGEFESNSFSFTIQGNGYIGGGAPSNRNYIPVKVDLWKYEPEGDLWKQKETLVTENRNLYDFEAVSNENFGYFFIYNGFFEFNPIFNIWQRMADLEDRNKFCIALMFSYGNKIFIVGVKNNLGEKSFTMWSYEK